MHRVENTRAKVRHPRNNQIKLKKLHILCQSSTSANRIYDYNHRIQTYGLVSSGNINLHKGTLFK